MGVCHVIFIQGQENKILLGWTFLDTVCEIVHVKAILMPAKYEKKYMLNEIKFKKNYSFYKSVSRKKIVSKNKISCYISAFGYDFFIYLKCVLEY